MKLRIPLIITTAIALTGCGSIPKDSLVTPERVAPIVDQFKTACVKLNGRVNTPTLQGSQAQCVRGAYATDLLIHVNFVLLWSERPRLELEPLQTAVSVACEEDGGRKTDPYTLVGSTLRPVPNMQMKCVSDTWNATVQLGPKEEGLKTQVLASAPRGRKGAANEGAVVYDTLTRLIRYTTMAPIR